MKPNKYQILLLILIICVFVSNFIWLKRDTLPPEGNVSYGLFPGINTYLKLPYLKSLALRPFYSLSKIKEFIEINFSIYPPLIPLSYTLFYILFGPHTKMELIINSFYMAIALCAIYGIARKLYNAQAGLLSAFVFATLPGILTLGRCTYAEFFSTCLMTVALYYLLKSDFLAQRNYALIFGFFLGLTALAKWDFLPGIIGPVIVTLAAGYYFSKRNLTTPYSKRVMNLLLSVGLATLIAGGWYIICFKSLLWRFNNIPSEANKYPWFLYGDHSNIQLEKLIFFPLTIVNTYAGIFYSAIALIGIIVLWLRWQRNYAHFNNPYFWHAGFFILWAVIPYIVLTKIGILSCPHIIMVLPVVALAVGAGIAAIRQRLIKTIFIIFVLVLGILIHLRSFIPLPKLTLILDRQLSPTKKGIRLSPNLMWWEKRLTSPPDRRDWMLQEILSFISSGRHAYSRKPTVAILQLSSLDFRDLQYYNFLYNYGLNIAPDSYGIIGNPQDTTKFDYIVFISSLQQLTPKLFDATVKRTYLDGNFYFTDWNKIREDIFVRRAYSLVKTFALPDKYIAKIYEFVAYAQ